MTIRAKFILVEKTETAHDFNLKWHPVISGSKENEEYFKYTPWGELKLGGLKAIVANHLTVGKAYYLDIIEAE